MARSKERPELVVLDPPRAGMSPEAMQRLAENGAGANYLRFVRAADAGARPCHPDFRRV